MILKPGLGLDSGVLWANDYNVPTASPPGDDPSSVRQISLCGAQLPPYSTSTGVLAAWHTSHRGRARAAKESHNMPGGWVDWPHTKHGRHPGLSSWHTTPRLVTRGRPLPALSPVSRPLGLDNLWRSFPALRLCDSIARNYNLGDDQIIEMESCDMIRNIPEAISTMKNSDLWRSINLSSADVLSSQERGICHCSVLKKKTVDGKERHS